GRTVPTGCWTCPSRYGMIGAKPTDREAMMKPLTYTLAAAACGLAVAFPAFASGSKTAASTPLYPDVVEVVPSHLAIQNDHQREWLRFSTTHINVGKGNLQIRGGGQIAPCVIDGIAYAQCTVATQEILDANGTVVATHPAGVAFFHPEHNHWHQS